VLQLKLADVVVTQGLLSVKEQHRSELLLDFWRSARKCGEIAERLEKQLFDRLSAESTRCEEAWLAKVERDARDDPYPVFDEAVAQLPTEKMIRLYAAFCEQRISSGTVSFFEIVSKRSRLNIQ
jgi:hypothetical protein